MAKKYIKASDALDNGMELEVAPYDRQEVKADKYGRYVSNGVDVGDLELTGTGEYFNNTNWDKMGSGYAIVTNPYDAATGNQIQERKNSGTRSTGNNDLELMSDDSYNEILRYQKAFADAQAAGDTEGMNAAHEAAEAVRAKYGYSGGADGSEYLGLMTYVGDNYGNDSGGYGNGGYYDDLGSFSYGNAPDYISRWQSQIDSLANAILNREAFSYNKDEDPLYQQYADSYTRSGKRAMQDTLGQVSARTGGMASSYATTASQQAYNNYMSALADKVPELYQLAYSMYQDDLSNQRSDLSMLQGLDDSDYNKYLTELSQWNTDRDFNYNSYRDSVSDSQWQQTFDYNASRDSVADQQWQLQFEYQQAQDALSQQNWESEFEYQKAQDALDREYQERQLALKNTVKTGGDGGSFDLDYFYSLPEDQAYEYVSNYKDNTEAKQWMTYWEDNNTYGENYGEDSDREVLNRTSDDGNSVYISHIGWVDYQELLEKVQKGEVREIDDPDDGTIRFVAVYNK